MSGQAKKEKALVIGAAGFVGGYLLAHLRNALGWHVTGTRLVHEHLAENSADSVRVLDILDPDAVKKTLLETAPDTVFHLAAQSSVGLSWEKPGFTAEVNVIGTLNVLEAIRAVCPTARTLMVGSSEEYGYLRPDEIPVKEDTLPRPGNIYAVTKNTQNLLAAVYAKSFHLEIVSTRSFNHIGPRQATGFVLPDFCKQVAEIEQGFAEPVLHVGNLDAMRDFCDVRDIVVAYGLLAQKGGAGQTYNVGSGLAVPIRYLLDLVLENARIPIAVKPDPARMRPSDVPEIRADITKLQALTSWKPQIALEATVAETLAYWRDRVRNAGSPE